MRLSNRKTSSEGVVAILVTLGLLAGLLITTAAANPQLLKGKIITNSMEILVPSTEANFVSKLRAQDRSKFKRNEDGKWVIHYVAFFSQPLPANHAGVVVLDAKGEPASVLGLKLTKGQTNLSGFIEVEQTATPNRQHLLQIYYARNNKPVILAKKPILLR